MDFRDIVPWGREKDPFTLLKKEMNRVFEDFSQGFPLDPFSRKMGEGFQPKVNISESDKEITVSAELPGMDDKDIDVSLSKNELTIKGEKKEEKEEKKENFYHMERTYGSFQRTLPLPSEVEDNKAEANFKNGVLTIKLPKAPHAIKETKKIEVKTG
jgi:HSP20 family protein